MGKTITITEDQLRKIVEVEVRFALAKAKFPIDGFSIVKHAVRCIHRTDKSHHYPNAAQ